MSFGYELLNVLRGEHCKGLNVDCFSIEEELPEPTSLPKAYIINSERADSSTGKLGHWVALYVSRDRSLIYFDSYGLMLSPIYEKVLAWGSKYHPFVYNKKIIQDFTSNACGAHCVAFVYFMFMQVPLDKFLSFYSDNLKENDKLAFSVYKTLRNG